MWKRGDYWRGRRYVLAIVLALTSILTAQTAPIIATSPNLALGRMVRASSSEGIALDPSRAIDGNAFTRWASLKSDPQWIYVDLGTKYDINTVVLKWETAYGRDYQIQVSEDAASWTTVFSRTGGKGGIETLSIAGTGRYVRMYGTSRGAPSWSYSLWEFEVYGAPSAPAGSARFTPTATPVPLTPTRTPALTPSPTVTATPARAATVTPTPTVSRTAPITATPRGAEPLMLTPAMTPTVESSPTPTGIIKQALPLPRARPAGEAYSGSPAPRRITGGIPTAARNTSVLLAVPYRSQFDGTPYAQANCGPATLAMTLEAYGISVSTHELRLVVNMLQGSSGYDDGTGWQALEAIALDYGLAPLDLQNQGIYGNWTAERVREHLREGHPVMILAKYRYLPGNGNAAYGDDHYIMITGLYGDGFIYNDSAYWGDDGYGLIMDEDVMVRAWGNSLLPMTAMAIAPGPDRPPLPRLLDRVLRSGRGSGEVDSDPVSHVAAAILETAHEEHLPEENVVAKSFGVPFDTTPELDDEAILGGLPFQEALNVDQEDDILGQSEDMSDEEELRVPVVLGLLILLSQIAPKRVSRYL